MSLLFTRPVLSLITFSLLYRLLITSILHLTQLFLPLFDTSPSVLLSPSSPFYPFVRWDVIWFIRLAQEGAYTHEQETAFSWGWIEVMRCMGDLVELFGGKGWTEVERLVLGGVIASWAAGIGATVVLYHLTLRLTSSPSISLLSSLLYILSPSPGALLSPSTEPLAALLTFSGQYFLARPLAHKPSASLFVKFASLGNLLASTICFALGTSVRPLGMLNAGFVWWNLIVRPAWEGTLKPSRVPSRALACTLSTLAIIYPFFRSQRAFYLDLCVNAAAPADWCSNKIPLLYTHVQAKYWNVGFLNYWTVSQIPNFIIALPIFAVLTYAHYSALSPIFSAPPPSGPPPFSRNQLSSQSQASILLKPKPKTEPSPESSSTTVRPATAASSTPTSLSTPSTSKSFSAKTDSRITSPPYNSHSHSSSTINHPTFLASPQFLTFILHSLATTFILFFNSHVQIALRLAQTLPVFYWGAAQLILARPSNVGDVGMDDDVEDRREKGVSWWGRVYLRWVVAWSLVATVLWAGFYPPA